MDFLHLFRAGGFMMYPLILASIIVVAIFIERFRYYHASRSNVEKLAKDIPEYLRAGDVEGLKEDLKQDGGIPASVILAGVEHLSMKASQTSIIEGAASHAAGLLKNKISEIIY
jgi:biopolymer transport protein ExbB